MPGPGVTVCSYLHLDISRSDVAVWMPLSLLGFLHPGWKLLFHVATASRCIFMQVPKLEWERWRCDRQITLWLPGMCGSDAARTFPRTRRSSAICGHRVCCTERRSSETWNRFRFVFIVLFGKFLLLFTRGPLPRHHRERVDSTPTTVTVTVTHPG